jgi:methionyl-tRNA formyltransferase
MEYSYRYSKYRKAEEKPKLILSNVLSDIVKVKFAPQNKSEIEVYPQRSPDDGELDLSNSAKDLYNFIRAQSSLYPKPFIITVVGKKLMNETEGTK